jgi:hypothetical protein
MTAAPVQPPLSTSGRVEVLTDAGLIVIPNCHTLDAGWCCSENDESGLWFNDRWPAAKYFAAWQDMAERHQVGG